MGLNSGSGSASSPDAQWAARLASVARERDDLARQVAVISTAVRSLTAMRTPDDVIEAAVRTAAELISPSAAGARRAVYFVIDGDVARIVGQFDESGKEVAGPIRIADHPALAEVVRSERPMVTTFDASTLGHTAAEAVTTTRITHGAAVPIVVDGRLAGVLAVGGREAPVEEFDRLVDLGGVVELALTNALFNEQLAEQAVSDSLTGCLNRRGLILSASVLSDREPYAVISADLDGLKSINDEKGHAAGDAALQHFVDVVQRVTRTGDVAARVGGDEFVVLLHNCDLDGGKLLAERILDNLDRSKTGLRASLGVASGPPPAMFDETCRLADLAMYRAKRSGGHRYELAEDDTR